MAISVKDIIKNIKYKTKKYTYIIFNLCLPGLVNYISADCDLNVLTIITIEMLCRKKPIIMKDVQSVC